MEEKRLLRKLCEADGTVIDEHVVDSNGTIVTFIVYDFKDDIYVDVKHNGENVYFSKLDRKSSIAE